MCVLFFIGGWGGGGFTTTAVSFTTMVIITDADPGVFLGVQIVKAKFSGKWVGCKYIL